MFHPPAAMVVEDSQSTVVVLLDPSLPADAAFDAVSWPDPHSGANRVYLLLQQCRNETTATSFKESDDLKSTTICCEIQSLQNDHASYLISGGSGETSSPLVVGRRSDLWCVTPLDPLFFLLAHCGHEPPTTTMTTVPWQPLDQLWAPLSSSPSSTSQSFATSNSGSNTNNSDKTMSLESLLRQPLYQQQALAAFYDSLQMDDAADDETTVYYKFVATKALQWLTRKQQAVERVLLQQQQQAKATNDSTTGGAFASGFGVSDDLMVVETTTTTTTAATTTVSPGNSQDDKETVTPATTSAKTLTDPTAHMESLQIICSYLNDSWRLAFLTHLGESPETCLDPAAALGKKRRVTVDTDTATAAMTLADTVRANDWNAAMTTGESNVGGSKQPTMQATNNTKRTLQQKKLAKVNTKGMSKLSAFFTKKK